jgi:amino-acid N-acetyltransferase
MKSKITLRPARETDKPVIRRLVFRARLNPSGIKWQRFIVGVVPTGDVIACVQIKPHRDGSQELASLVVAPEYRGKEIARLVLEHLLQNQKGDLYLMCRSSLGGFYRKFGFIGIPEPQMPPYFQRISRLASIAAILREEGETLLVMHRSPDQGSKNAA